MNWLEWHTLEIGDARIVAVERVRELADAGRLEDAMQLELADTRDRLAERLRTYRRTIRRRGEAAGRRDGLAEIATAFAGDCDRWKLAATRLRAAVERALAEIAPAVPTTVFLEAALRELWKSRDGGRPWVLYINVELLTDAERFLAEADSPAQANVRVVHAGYLAEGVCVVETADGVVELRGDLERQQILDAIRDAVLDDVVGAAS